MTKEELQNYIVTQIPIVKASRFEVSDVSGVNVTITGKHQDHINHHNSVFGGTISTILTLAAWSQVRLLMEGTEPFPLILVKSHKTDFIKPVFNDFSAKTRDINQSEIEHFRDVFTRFGKSRLNIYADLTESGGQEILARYSGEFVVIGQNT